MKLEDFYFRVWDISKKRFYNDLEFSMLPSDKDSLNINLGIIFAKNLETASMFGSNYEIELFTGFYDKNKKQIYEGDIVGLYDIFNNIYERREVVFENAQFALKHQNTKYGHIPLANLYQTQKELDNIDFKTLRGIKVIGNIHENSELLNY